MSVALPTSRSIAMHEAHHVAALCLAGMVPKCVRIDWPTAELAGFVTIDWGDGADPDKAQRVLVAVLLGAMTEGFAGWDNWPIDPDRAPVGARRDAEQARHLAEYQARPGRLAARSVEGQRVGPSLRFPATRRRNRRRTGARRGADYPRPRGADRHYGGTMEHLTVKAVATATDLGEFSAIAATYDIDRVKDQIAPGAFERTIAQWQASGKNLLVHWNHSGAAADIIGAIDPAAMREIPDEGLYIEGKLDLEESEVAREAWRSMKNNAVSLSFGYLATKTRKRRDGIQDLLEIDLFEITVAPGPANPKTRFLSLKAVAGRGRPDRR
jgi:HK97 family phage prohead protease